MTKKANVFRTFKIKIQNDRDLPAFGAFCRGTSEDTIEIVLNMEVSALAGVEHRIDFYELLSETTVHELLHAFQELYKKAFDEDEVENALEQARKFLDNKKKKKTNNKSR
jgi:hypothetical protein